MLALLFDTETSDLIRNKHRPLAQQPHITEFFGLKLQGVPVSAKGEKKATVKWKEKDTWWSLFNPGIPLSKEVQRITGLDDATLKGEPAFRSKAAALKAFIEDCDMVVAHNLSFDMDMVNFEMQRAEVTVNWPKQRVCTVEATEHLRGRRLKLIELHGLLFGEPFENAHRAENDVRPMARCFIELSNRGLV